MSIRSLIANFEPRQRAPWVADYAAKSWSVSNSALTLYFNAQPGDYVLLLIGSTYYDAMQGLSYLGTPSGFTDLNSATSNIKLCGRKLTSSLSQLSFSYIGGTPAEISACVVVVRGADATSPLIEFTFYGSSSGNANSPAVSVENNSLVVSAIRSLNPAYQAVQPTGYTLLGKTYGPSNTTYNVVAAAYKTIPLAGSEDPPSWTTSGATANSAFSVSFRPLPN